VFVVRGNENRVRSARGFEDLAQSLNDFEAGSVRQADIEQQQVGQCFGDSSDGTGAHGGGSANFEIALSFRKPFELAHGGGLVLH